MSDELGELVRAVGVSFTPGELHRFAKGFRVLTDQEGSTDAGARLLVGAMSRRGELGRLVARLRQQKPDVTWPELADAPPAAAATIPAAPLPDPVQVEPEEPPPPARPRWGARIAAGAALLLLGGMLGSGATYLFMRQREAPAERARVAAIASEALSTAVAAVARACEAETGASSARESLAEAFRRCAKPPAVAVSPGGGLPPTFPDPEPRAAPRRDRPPGSAPRSGGADPCLDGCRREHDECVRADCGPEPGGANDYPGYQRCLSGCLAKSSRCRLRC